MRDAGGCIPCIPVPTVEKGVRHHTDTCITNASCPRAAAKKKARRCLQPVLRPFRPSCGTHRRSGGKLARTAGNVPSGAWRIRRRKRGIPPRMRCRSSSNIRWHDSWPPPPSRRFARSRLSSAMQRAIAFTSCSCRQAAAQWLHATAQAWHASTQQCPATSLPVEKKSVESYT